MKPRTKLQKAVVGCSEKLPPLSSYQIEHAIREVAPHMAKHNSKNEYVCLDCGHKWTGKRSTKVVCPSCKRTLDVDTSRKCNYSVKDWVAVVTTCKKIQVIRMFFMATHLKKGEPARYWIDEAFQRWIIPNGENIIISRKRPWMARYCDIFDFGSELSLKEEVTGHTVAPYKVIGQSRVIPELKRNGFDGKYHDVNPYRLFTSLLTNNKIETLWKTGQYNLVKHFIKTNMYKLNEYWPSIKVAMRHHYIVKDASLWMDFLSCLKELNKDVRNPTIILPQNLVQAHDMWRARCDAERQRAYERMRRERIAGEWKRYIESEAYRIDEYQYQQLKSKFFDLEFRDEGITVKPLTSIKEFSEEGKLMHHCVFGAKYYQKDDSLIFHAVADGVSIATIELNLSTLEIVQCRGKFNSKPEQYDRIVALINNNKNQIAKLLTA